MSTVNERSLSHEVKEKIAFALTERELSINDERDPEAGWKDRRRIGGEMGIRSTVMAPPRRHPGDTLDLPTVAVALVCLSSLSAAPSAITMGKKGKLLDYSLLPSFSSILSVSPDVYSLLRSSLARSTIEPESPIRPRPSA